MKQEDIERLQAPYASGDQKERQREYCGCLGIRITETDLLGKALLSTLDAKNKGHPQCSSLDFRRRVLASDTLLRASTSVVTNLVEAAIHALEVRGAIEREAEAKSRRMQPSGGRPFSYTPPSRPMDDITDAMTELHIAGFFRAAAAALDCLGIAMIGALGLPTPILSGSMGAALNAGNKMRADVAKGRLASTAGTNLQLAAVSHCGQALSDSGPDDWHGWTKQMRHMYAHRPRRLVLSQVTPQPLSLVQSSGYPYLRSSQDYLLPRDPSRCDIDVLVDAGTPERLVLSETAETTIRGVLSSLTKACESIARGLRRVWAVRTARTDFIHQPAAQWPPADSQRKTNFDGYASGSFIPKVDALMLPGTTQPRFEAAAVLDHDRSLWASNPFT